MKILNRPLLCTILASSSDTESYFPDTCPEVQPCRFTGGDHAPTFPKLTSRNKYLEYFRKSWSDDVMTLLVHETNRYGRAKYGIKWTETTKDELNGFLGATMHMTIIVLPAIRDYWFRSFQQPHVTRTFKYNRYRQLLSCIHLADNSASTADRLSPDYDKIHHIRPLINILNTNSAENFNFGCHGSIDEAMVKFKGRSSIKQFIKNKPGNINQS